MVCDGESGGGGGREVEAFFFCPPPHLFFSLANGGISLSGLPSFPFLLWESYVEVEGRKGGKGGSSFPLSVRSPPPV